MRAFQRIRKSSGRGQINFPAHLEGELSGQVVHAAAVHEGEDVSENFFCCFIHNEARGDSISHSGAWDYTIEEFGWACDEVARMEQRDIKDQSTAVRYGQFAKDEDWKKWVTTRP